MSSLHERVNQLRGKSPESLPGEDRKFGTFAGVFTPTALTILGVIMYLRLAWVVGNAGLLGGLLIILLAHVVTISTGMSVASIATNIRVGAGGAFSIISQSLGLEVGGSVSVLLYLALSISIALYIFGFTAGVINILPDLPQIVVIFASFLVIAAIAYVSAKLASQIQFLILAVVILSLVSISLGAFPIGDNPGMTQSPELWGDFPDGNFWVIFAVYFPAVTGIMAGISLSGTLKNPRRSLPIGILSSVGLTMLIYLSLAFWLAKIAPTDELLNTDPDEIVMVNRALWGWSVQLGLLGATFSSALASMVAAPRVMQALGQHNVLPRSSFFAQETKKGEPRKAMLVTGVIVLVVLIISIAAGGLNAIAPLITMFFLLTYSMINGVVLLEQSLGMVSFRPTFAIPRIVPLTGLVSCLFVMFLINPTFSLISIVCAFGIFIYLVRKNLDAPWEDVRSGLFGAIAGWASDWASRVPSAVERTWSPHILVPITNKQTVIGSYRFLKSVASPQGSIRILGLYPKDKREQLGDLKEITSAFEADGISCRCTVLESPDNTASVSMTIEILNSDLIHPNILFLPLLDDGESIDYGELVKNSDSHRIGVMLLARHPVLELGKEQSINVWMREQGPEWKLGMRLSNLDLSVLLALQLSRNWDGEINLFMAVQDDETEERARKYQDDLIELARLPSKTRSHVFQGSFREAIRNIPAADINFFGLPNHFDPEFLMEVFEAVDASCLFVRDSGDESALA